MLQAELGLCGEKGSSLQTRVQQFYACLRQAGVGGVGGAACFFLRFPVAVMLDAGAISCLYCTYCTAPK